MQIFMATQMFLGNYLHISELKLWKMTVHCMALYLFRICQYKKRPNDIDTIPSTSNVATDLIESV